MVNGSERPLWLLLIPHVSRLLNAAACCPQGTKPLPPAGGLAHGDPSTETLVLGTPLDL